MFCKHKWKIINKIKQYEHGNGEMPYGTKYILQCEKCGKIKKKEI